MNKTTAIIGSNGYFGKNLSFLLHKRKIKNFDFDIHPKSNYKWMNYSQIDITKKNSFDNLNEEIDIIFFLAAVTGTTSDHKKCYNVNVLGLINLLEHIKDFKNKPSIVFPSTRLIYKGKQNKLLSEIDCIEIKSIYALTKLIGEETLKLYNKLYDINYDVLRICVPHSNMVDDNYSYGTISFFLDKAKNKLPINIFGDGSLKRTFTHIEDICKIFILISEKKFLSNSIYNIGGHTYSILEAAKKIAFKYNSEIKFVKWTKKSLKMESGDTIFDSSKLDSYIDFENYKDLYFKKA